MSIESSQLDLLLISISLALLSVTWLKNLFQKQSEPKEPSDPLPTSLTEVKDTQERPEPKTEPVPQGITMGTLLNGRYLLKAELGSGGFGIVYLAEDQRAMNKRVVIKCLLDSKEQSKDFAWYEKKFNQEQEALVRIKHPHVVEVTEIGQAPNGKPYFVMEYVEGVSLQRLMANDRLNLKRISNIMEQTCKAVSAAHDRGVLHCDLKPANIMVQSLSDGEDHVKVIDFGIAKLTGSQFARTDEPTKLAGSLPYMAPEQHMGQVSKASDVYALGIIAYQMATRLPPINSGSLVFEDYDVRLKIADSNLTYRCGELPEPAREVILKAMARNSADRYQQAREFGRELARAIRGEGTPKSAAQMRVTILYKRNTEPDNEILQMLESGLTAKDFKVFVDRHLAVGMEWAKEIEKQIRASDAVIPLISEASAASEMMAYEIETALKSAQEHQGKPRILPIRINHEVPLADSIGSILEPLQYTLWKSSNDNERVVSEIIEALQTPFEYKPAKLPKIGETVVGAVPLDSEFYIVRPTDEEFLSALAHRDSIVLIKGGRQMGKTSLLARGLKQARIAGSKVVLTDFQKLNSTHMQSAEVLFKTLGAMIAEQLDLDALPEDVWDERRGASLNFERFLKREVLRKISQPLVWAMDEIDRLFSCDFGSEVFGLFRSWHNDRQLDPEGPWQQLTLVIVYATEAHLFITDLNQSPFNVGTRLTLSDFTFEQVFELNRRYGSPLKSRGETERFYQLLSGQPFLVRRGLQGLAAHKITFDEMEKTADRNEGPFGDHLRRLLVLIAQDGDLIKAMRGLIHEGVPPPDNIFYRLRSAGILVGDSEQETQLRCQLYTNYFARHL